VTTGRASRAAVTVVFGVLGAATGTWAARIPAIKAELHLSPGILGLVLLGPAVGAVLAMPATGAILASMPPRRVIQAGLLAVACLLPVTTVAGSPWQLFIILAGWGAGIGAVDVAMNTEAAAVQDRLGRRVMSGFHAVYSIGGLAGAGLGAVAAGSGVSARANFGAAAAVVLLAGLVSTRAFTARTTGREARERPRRSRWPRRSWTLVVLAVMSCGCFLAEGAANDWSAVYLHSSLSASTALAAVGFTLFSSAMAGGRLAGDRLATWLGPMRLVRLSAGVATVGFGAALLAGRVWAGLAGFALLGAGLSVVVPLVFTAAARLGPPGPNLALVTSCGYLGLLIGPPMVGGLAELASLPVALGSVVVISGLTAVLAWVVGTPATPKPPGAGPPAPPESVLARDS
jgi:MFS family permease